jgi:hypothetical protein
MLVALGFAVAGPQRAHATTTKGFCPAVNTVAYWDFSSGETCTGYISDGSSYSSMWHHLNWVLADNAYPQYGNQRHCANYYVPGPGGTWVLGGAWKCDYDHPTYKFPGGNAGLGTHHNGDPSFYEGFSFINF